MPRYHSGLLIATLGLSGCAIEVAYEPGYLTETTPTYRAEADVLIIMHDHDLEYVYEGWPESQTGETIRLTMPIGAILQEVSARVFQSFFTYGVGFVEDFDPRFQYFIAVEPEVRNFSYRYDRRIDPELVELRPSETGFEVVPLAIITPSIQFQLAIKAYDRSGRMVLDRIYPSGVVAGESYVVTSRPHERINATFHAALQALMLVAAEDLRPFIEERL